MQKHDWTRWINVPPAKTCSFAASAQLYFQYPANISNRTLTAIYAETFKVIKESALFFFSFFLPFLCIMTGPSLARRGQWPDLSRPLTHRLPCPYCRNENIHLNGNGLCVGCLYFSCLTVMQFRRLPRRASCPGAKHTGTRGT